MSLLIFTVASGEYLEYADIFQYCVNQSYPEYSIKVLKNYSDTVKFMSPCMRYLIEPEEYLNKYDYYYITDIDMMILAEDKSIVDFHTEEMRQTGLSYSNTIRNKEALGSERMTGLHFCTPQWYKTTHTEREKYKDFIIRGEYGHGKYDDETMLKKITMGSGLDLPPRYGLIRRHHGIHIGTIRDFYKKKYTTIKNQLTYRVALKQCIKWQDVYQSGGNKIISKIKNKKIREEFSILDKYTMGRIKCSI